MKTLTLLLLLLTSINIEEILNWKCGTDNLKIQPKELKIKRLNINPTGPTVYVPIAIGYDFTTLKKPDSMSDSIFSDVKKILKETREEFSKFLKITHKEIDLSNYKKEIIENCNLSFIGQDYSNFLIKNDLIVFPIFKDLGDDIIASASPCVTESSTYRPIAGVLNINPKLDFESINVEYYMKNIFLHEIIHILAFHPYFFTNLKLGDYYYLNSYNVLEQAREHYDCSSLERLYLENQEKNSGWSSHWESRYMLGDIMISTDFQEKVISDMTLALFEDTGFYKVNYYTGGLFKFGKNKGCDFLNKRCIINEYAQFNEFCEKESEPKCSYSRSIKSSCYIHDYTNELSSEYQYFSNPKRGGFFAADYCPVPFESHPSNYYYPKHCLIGKSDDSNVYGEKLGNNSFCFISSLLPNNSESSVSTNAICYEVECDSINKKIIVKIDSNKIICPTEGGTIYPDGFKGSLECPHYYDICPKNGDPLCNEMFSCFTALANKNNYDYKITYYDSEGPEEKIVDSEGTEEKKEDSEGTEEKKEDSEGTDEKKEDSEGTDEKIEILKVDKSIFISMNLILLGLILFFLY